MEREETEASSERAERLANLLTLSYEPMLAWHLDGFDRILERRGRTTLRVCIG